METVTWAASTKVHGLKVFRSTSAKAGVVETLCGRFPRLDVSWSYNRNIDCGICERVLEARGIPDVDE